LDGPVSIRSYFHHKTAGTGKKTVPSRNSLTVCNYEKAFDKVSRTKLWTIFGKKGFPKHFVKAVEACTKILK
jgi:hypothetical protein